ncbi:hypothetical protein BaRGS_00032025 [Batillaria attramentaria]|uniref:Uncharacterized protein n=1 Tax=Batillaria attramentaria TaxID=370345 RepID=A0ABD0JQH0_9CAEN
MFRHPHHSSFHVIACSPRGNIQFRWPAQLSSNDVNMGAILMALRTDALFRSLFLESNPMIICTGRWTDLDIRSFHLLKPQRRRLQVVADRIMFPVVTVHVCTYLPKDRIAPSAMS